MSVAMEPRKILLFFVISPMHVFCDCISHCLLCFSSPPECVRVCLTCLFINRVSVCLCVRVCAHFFFVPSPIHPRAI